MPMVSADVPTNLRQENTNEQAFTDWYNTNVITPVVYALQRGAETLRLLWPGEELRYNYIVDNFLVGKYGSDEIGAVVTPEALRLLGYSEQTLDCIRVLGCALELEEMQKTLDCERNPKSRRHIEKDISEIRDFLKKILSKYPVLKEFTSSSERVHS